MFDPTIRLEGEILFAGDWHGSTTQAANAINHAAQNGVKLIVQLGDFGIWRDDRKFLDKTNRMLESKNMHLSFVDGNHEDFPRLYEHPLNDYGLRPVRKRIWHLPRGTRLDWEGVSVLALGGAASIDKKHRRKGHSWWPEEFISDDEAELAIAGGRADMMWCHDSPHGAPNSIVDDPYLQNLSRRDFGSDVMDYCEDHRKVLARVTHAAQPRVLLHGHYHMAMSGYYRHPSGITASVRGLDQGSKPARESMLILSPLAVQQHIQELDKRY